MKNLILFIALAASISSCWGTKGNGNVNTQEREVGSFDKIDVGGAFDIYLKQGNKHKVVVEADDNLLPIIKTEVSDGVLKISSNEPIRRAKKLAVYITVPELTVLDGSGACDIHSQGQLSGNSLDIDFSGAVEAELNLSYQKLSVDCSGAAELDLMGNVERVRIETSGAAEIDAGGMQVSEMYISASGASDIDVDVSRELEVKISGAAEIEYSGNPNITKEISGAASIHPRS